ncbi:TraR/DksA C4-type zinc finger protein [Caulobacter segnis]|uniref:TraR/DksA C4-type zinc finger protein n=1 Tax=Caulobacter segnis TaxID=88688 RepID=UPI00269551A5|nr:TraR/DksA C4-type zinc finger protein [Caulobacter segnis]
MTDFADEAQEIEIAERESAVAEIRRRAAPPVQVFFECLACGDPIETARLSVNPAARRCLMCQEAYERLQLLRSKG